MATSVIKTDPIKPRTSFFQKLFKCCKTTKKQTAEVSPLPITTHNPGLELRRPATSQPELQAPQIQNKPTPLMSPEFIEANRLAQEAILKYFLQKKKEHDHYEPAFKIVTKYKKEEIKMTDSKPENDDTYKFLCPICFKYFNHI